MNIIKRISINKIKSKTCKIVEIKYQIKSKI